MSHTGKQCFGKDPGRSILNQSKFMEELKWKT